MNIDNKDYKKKDKKKVPVLQLITVGETFSHYQKALERERELIKKELQQYA